MAKRAKSFGKDSCRKDSSCPLLQEGLEGIDLLAQVLSEGPSGDCWLDGITDEVQVKQLEPCCSEDPVFAACGIPPKRTAIGSWTPVT